MYIIFFHLLTWFPATEMHLVQHFCKARIPLQKNFWSCSFSQPFVVQITFSLSILCICMGIWTRI